MNILWFNQNDVTMNLNVRSHAAKQGCQFVQRVIAQLHFSVRYWSIDMFKMLRHFRIARLAAERLRGPQKRVNCVCPTLRLPGNVLKPFAGSKVPCPTSFQAAAMECSGTITRGIRCAGHRLPSRTSWEKAGTNQASGPAMSMKTITNSDAHRGAG